MGGIWERLIRSIRKIMHALLFEQKVSDESFATVLRTNATTHNVRSEQAQIYHQAKKA